MKKYNKWNVFLDRLAALLAGTFIIKFVYTYWDYRTHPEVYAAFSAPWYTSVQLYGAAALAAAAIAAAGKAATGKQSDFSGK